MGDPRSEPTGVEWWFLSFVDRQTGKQLGACVVRGRSFDQALTRSHRLRINPGGEVAGVPCDPDDEPIEPEKLYRAAAMRRAGY